MFQPAFVGSLMFGCKMNYQYYQPSAQEFLSYFACEIHCYQWFYATADRHHWNLDR
jgi:hypothetical protein